jgi:hypothetical protein
MQECSIYLEQVHKADRGDIWLYQKNKTTRLCSTQGADYFIAWPGVQWDLFKGRDGLYENEADV